MSTTTRQILSAHVKDNVKISLAMLFVNACGGIAFVLNTNFDSWWIRILSVVPVLLAWFVVSLAGSTTDSSAPGKSDKPEPTLGGKVKDLISNCRAKKQFGAFSSAVYYLSVILMSIGTLSSLGQFGLAVMVKETRGDLFFPWVPLLFTIAFCSFLIALLLDLFWSRRVRTVLSEDQEV